MLKGNNIRLRALEPGDLETLYEWENNTEIWAVTGTYIPFSRVTLKNYIESVKDIFADKQFRFVIENPEKQPVGLIDLFEFDPFHLRAGIGILIADTEHRRKGYAKEALGLTVQYARDVLKLKSLFCNILESNSKSISLFENAGFTATGTKKEWFRNGSEWEDEYFLQLIL